MIARIVTVAVLTAGVTAFFSPSFAQTATGMPSGGGSGMTGGGAMPSSGGVSTGTSGATGSGGTVAPMTSSTPSGSMATGQSGTMSGSGSMNSGSTGMQGGGQYHVNQAQSPRRGGARGMDAAERQVTECLNNAAAQRSSLDACKR